MDYFTGKQRELGRGPLSQKSFWLEVKRKSSCWSFKERLSLHQYRFAEWHGCSIGCVHFKAASHDYFGNRWVGWFFFTFNCDKRNWVPLRIFQITRWRPFNEATNTVWYHQFITIPPTGTEFRNKLVKKKLQIFVYLMPNYQYYLLGNFCHKMCSIQFYWHLAIIKYWKVNATY